MEPLTWIGGKKLTEELLMIKEIIALPNLPTGEFVYKRPEKALTFEDLFENHVAGFAPSPIDLDIFSYHYEHHAYTRRIGRI